MVDRMGKQTLGAAGQRTLRRIHRKWQLYLLILPAIVSVFIFHYIPIYGVQIAFKNFRSSKGILGSEWVGFKHFARFLAYPDFWKILWNTVRISLYALATFPCPVILALMMNELNSERYKKFMQMVTFAPHFISTVAVCSMVLLFFDRSQGLVNNVIAALGGERYDFVSSTRYFSSLYVWSGVWQNLGWNAIIYIAALSSVSPELIEAARVDGATRLQIVRYVNFPAILPTVITMLILSAGSLLNVGFEKIYLLQNPLNMEASRVISTYVYEIGLQGGQFSYSTAIGLFNNVVNIVVIILVNGISKRVTRVALW